VRLPRCLWPALVSTVGTALACTLVLAGTRPHPAPTQVALAVRPATFARCLGRDRDGSQCRNAVRAPGRYCYVHGWQAR
jgi:hypothetical protein